MGRRGDKKAKRGKSGVCTYCGKVHRKGKKYAGTPQGSCRGHPERRKEK